MRTKSVSLFLVLFLFALSMPFSLAGANKALPLNHTYKVYEDLSSGKLYWPLKMPYYIRLASSPDPEAETYLLDKAMIKSPEKPAEFKKIDEGIKLEISGMQYIRWFNYVTKDTINLYFRADGEAPEVNHNFISAPRYDSGRNLYFGKDLRCTLSAVDTISGVEDIFFSIDGAKFEAFNNNLFFNREKEVNFRYYAVDNVGNTSSPKELNFTVDLTPPFSTFEVIENYSGNILSPQTVIQLISRDKLSNVQKVHYTFDNAKNTLTYQDDPIPVENLSDGEHTLSFFAVDNVENKENKQSYTFYLDKTPPSISRRVIGDQYSRGGNLYVSTRSRIELTASDNKIGLRHIEKAINSDKFSVYSEPFAAPFNASEKSIAYRALDKLGNTSQIEYFPLIMDMNPPETEHNVSGSHYEQRGITWINEKTKISLSSSDDKSGVKQIQYQIGIDPITNYSSAFSIPNEGNYTFKYWSTDNVNNREQNNVYSITIDNTAPEIFMYFSISSIDSETLPGGTTVEVFPTGTSLFIGATDASAGVNGIWYSINAGNEQTYQNPVEFNSSGTYKIKIRTIDKVDNQEVKNLQFKIQ